MNRLGKNTEKKFHLQNLKKTQIPRNKLNKGCERPLQGNSNGPAAKRKNWQRGLHEI
jgi:hypothetical protein